MTTERVLRAAAVLIALLAVIDPPVTLDGRTRRLVSIVAQDNPSMDLPVPNHQSARQVAKQVAARLRADLQRDFDLVDGRDEAAAWTIVVGDTYPAVRFPDAGGVSTVTLSHAGSPNTRIERIDAPASLPASTAARLRVTVEAEGVAGTSSEVTVRSRGALVGRSAHDWTSDRETWTTDITTVPVGQPPFRFAVDLTSKAAETTDLDNHASVDVDQAPPLRVFVLEPRPSWASVFVRRALESDPRFELRGSMQAAPQVKVTLEASATARTNQIDRFDFADAIVVGGLEALSSDQVAALEHFIVDRGGSVALVPDARVAGPVARRLLPSVDLAERLLDRPAKLTMLASARQLEASELLEGVSIPRRAVTLSEIPGSGRPVVWTFPMGEGLVLFAGALDAWRYRGASDDGFARFWRSVVAGLALEARPAIDVQLLPARAAPGERIRVTARIRKVERDRLGDRLAIDAHVGTDSLRLWPDAARSSFRGSFIAGAGSTSVTASIDGGSIQGTARLSIDPGARNDAAVPLSLLARSQRGVNVDAEHLGDLERHLRQSVATTTERQTRYPMRSSWWVAPFAACLCGEWWLRRKSGRR